MKLFLSSLALCTAFIMPPAQADLTTDCNKMLNRAQVLFSDLFPTDPFNQFSGNWCYRVYPGNQLARKKFVGEIVVGITSGDDDFPPGVYGMGGPFGFGPNFIDSRDGVFALLGLPLEPVRGKIKDAICDNSNSDINGLNITQDGTLITITTDGKCVKLPTNKNLCALPPKTDENGKPIPTNISMLTVTDLVNYEIKGFDIPFRPGLPNPLDFVTNNFTKSICFKHIQEDIVAFETKTDVCFDASDLVRNFPGISDKMTMAFKANSRSTIVDDCSNSGADIIINLVTGGSE